MMSDIKFVMSAGGIPEGPSSQVKTNQQQIKENDCRAAAKLRSGERLTNSEGAGIIDVGF